MRHARSKRPGSGQSIAAFQLTFTIKLKFPEIFSGRFTVTHGNMSLVIQECTGLGNYEIGLATIVLILHGANEYEYKFSVLSDYRIPSPQLENLHAQLYDSGQNRIVFDGPQLLTCRYHSHSLRSCYFFPFPQENTLPCSAEMTFVDNSPFVRTRKPFLKKTFDTPDRFLRTPASSIKCLKIQDDNPLSHDIQDQDNSLGLELFDDHYIQLSDLDNKNQDFICDLPRTYP
jgi:hypothetical protein